MDKPKNLLGSAPNSVLTPTNSLTASVKKDKERTRGNSKTELERFKEIICDEDEEDETDEL